MIAFTSEIISRSVCNAGTICIYANAIRPLRVGSLGNPERYRNLGAFSFSGDSAV
jgi:hypothetical protein